MLRPVYTLAGLRLISDFPLNGLQIWRGNAAPQDEVVIRRAAISESLPLIGTTFPNGQYNGKDILLDFPNVARFLLRDGNEILVDPAPSSDDGQVRAHLLGTTFGLLCHQRGIIPLHASAINVTDSFVAFVGESGAGKSTLAAALARRGHQVVADDVCFLRIDINGDITAWPGIARIRLWESAMHILGYDGPGVEREMHGHNKYFIPVVQPQNLSRPGLLRRVYELNDTNDGAANLIIRLQGSATVEVLMQNVYRMDFAERLGYKPYAFKVCTAAARRVAVFRFSRPRDFNALEQTVEFLDNHLHDTCLDHCNE